LILKHSKHGKSFHLKEQTLFSSEHIFINAEIFQQLMMMEVQTHLSSYGIFREKIRELE
jgi:hypothetical protein